MAIGDVYRLSAIWSDSTLVNINVNVFHFKQMSALVQPTPAEDLSLAFLTDVGPFYAACVSASLSLRILQFRTLTVPASGVDIDAGPLVGTLSGEQNLPRQIAPVISWRTPFIGRSYRGRTYMPLITEDHQNDGVLGSTYVTLAETFAVSMLSLNTGTASYAAWQLVVHSPTVPADTDVTAFIVDPICGTQRRRRYGIGG